MEKYVFVDLDGTLLKDDKTVCERNQKAIDKALENGHHLIVATGRPIESAILGASKAGLNRKGCYIISYNGGLIYDCTKEEIIFEKHLAMKTVEELFEKARDSKLHIQAYCEGKVWCEADTEEVRHYHSKGQMPYEIHRNVPKELTEPTRKCIVISFEEEKLRNFQEKTKDWEEGKAYSEFSTASYLEYLPEGVSKGQAIVEMSKILGFSIEDSIAIGDERNDMSMIRAAGLGVCMKNGLDVVKEIADYVTESDNNQGGVGEVIEKFVLKEDVNI